MLVWIGLEKALLCNHPYSGALDYRAFSMIGNVFKRSGCHPSWPQASAFYLLTSSDPVQGLQRDLPNIAGGGGWNHYFPFSSKSKDTEFRIPAHADAELFTLLFQQPVRFLTAI